MIITTPMSAIVLALIAAGDACIGGSPSHQASVSGAPSPTWERPVEIGTLRSGDRTDRREPSPWPASVALIRGTTARAWLQRVTPDESGGGTPSRRSVCPSCSLGTERSSPVSRKPRLHHKRCRTRSRLS